MNNQEGEESQKQEVDWPEPTNHVRVYPRLGEQLRHLFFVNAFSLPLAAVRVDVDQQASGSASWRRKQHKQQRHMGSLFTIKTAV